jgi:uncharacterized protein (TIGR02246 family)
MSREFTEADIDAIAALRQSFVTAIESDDVEGMVALLTEDGTAFPPHEPALVGRQANRAWHEQRITEFETAFTVSTDELIGDGDQAFERFSYTLTLTPREGGDALVDSGRCVWFWRRQDSEWKVARAMWNSPEPPDNG